MNESKSTEKLLLDHARAPVVTLHDALTEWGSDLHLGLEYRDPKALKALGREASLYFEVVSNLRADISPEKHRACVLLAAYVAAECGQVIELDISPRQQG